MGPTKRGKGTKLMAMADRSGLPLAACAASASPHEVTLVAPTLDSRFVDDLPQRLIGDRAYDADPLDAALAQLGHRDDRATSPRTVTVPKRKMAVHCDAIGGVGRWNASLLGSAISGVLVVRYERHALNYLGFVHLGCILILLRQRL